MKQKKSAVNDWQFRQQGCAELGSWSSPNVRPEAPALVGCTPLQEGLGEGQRDVPVQQEQRQSRLFRVAPVAAHVVEKVARTFRGAVVLQPHLCRVRKMRVEEPRERAGGAGVWP